MNYLLIVSLGVLLIYAYKLTDKDVLSPWVISCAMYISGMLIVILNKKNWNIDINGKTFVVIMCALIVFGMGELLTRYIFDKKYRYNRQNLKMIVKQIKISNFVMTSIILFMIVILLWYFKETQRLAMIGGAGEGELILKYARKASVNNGVSSILTLLLAFSMSIAYFFMFCISYNKIYFKEKAKWKVYMIPIGIFVLQSILTTGRQIFIQSITTWLVLTFVLLKLKIGWKKNNKKIIYIAILSVMGFLILFFILGFLTDKSFLGFNRTVSLYLGGPLIGLDKYLINPSYGSEYLGGNTLFGIYSSLSQLGVEVPKLYAPLEFFLIGYDGVNLYTPLRRYIQDFSYGGMIAIQFFLGTIYTSFLMHIRYRKKIGVAIIIFAMSFYPIVECAIEERFFMILLSFNGLYKIIGVVVLYYIFIKRKGRVDENRR